RLPALRARPPGAAERRRAAAEPARARRRVPRRSRAEPGGAPSAGRPARGGGAPRRAGGARCDARVPRAVRGPRRARASRRDGDRTGEATLALGALRARRRARGRDLTRAAAWKVRMAPAPERSRLKTMGTADLVTLDELSAQWRVAFDAAQ